MGQELLHDANWNFYSKQFKLTITDTKGFTKEWMMQMHYGKELQKPMLLI